MSTTPDHILTALDNASMTLAAPDARRVMRETANSLRGTMQRHVRLEALYSRLAGIKGNSNQATAQRADIEQQIDHVGTVDVASAVTKARNILAMWDGF